MRHRTSIKKDFGQDFQQKKPYMRSAKKARDNARTPMQWNAEENAGFTTGTPWYQINPNYKEINAEDETAREDSVFPISKTDSVKKKT